MKSLIRRLAVFFGLKVTTLKLYASRMSTLRVNEFPMDEGINHFAGEKIEVTSTIDGYTVKINGGKPFHMDFCTTKLVEV